MATGASIRGNSQANDLTGTDGDDDIRGRGGNDTLTGGAGDDFLHGGGGTDTVVFSGLRAEYSVTFLGNDRYRIEGPDGTDTVRRVELFEFADVTQTTSELMGPQLPNLAAGTLTADTESLAPGETATLEFGFASNGLSHAGASTARLLVATAPDAAAAIASQDVVVGQLDAGSSATAQATFDPTGLAPGSYWLAVALDATGALAETDETDNVSDWIEITVAPPVTDLRLTEATVTPASDFVLGDGGRVVVDYTVENASNIDAGDFRVVAYLSREGIVDPSDIFLGEATGNVAAGGSVSGTLDLPLFRDTPTYADWQVLTQVQWLGDEVDATPEDNTSLTPVTLTPAVADLRLDAATLGGRTDLDLTNGGRLEVTCDWANAGNDTPSFFTIRSYLSTDDQISDDDLSVLGISGGTFTGQQNSTTTSYFLQPGFAAGDYHLISVIAWGDGSADATPENNVVVQELTLVAPPRDIALTAASLSASSDLLVDDDGIRLDFTVDLANLGGLEHTTNLTAYLSTDRQFTPDDVRLPLGTATLDVGETVTASFSQTVTEDLPAGEYTLIIVSDTPDDNAQNAIQSIDLTLEVPDAPPVILGTEGSDVLSGTPGDDTIEALGGDDLILASEGFDFVDGGAGFDMVDFSGLTTGVQLFGDGFSEPGALFRQDPVTFAVDQTYRNIEAVIATEQDDLVSLLDSDVRALSLGGGDDLGLGSDGDDSIDGGAGNDLIAAGDGDDLIALGDGMDMVGVSRSVFGQFVGGDGHDIVVDFDPTQDILYFQVQPGIAWDPFDDFTQTAEGALLAYADNSSILLEGVDLAGLSAANFFFEEIQFVSAF